MVEEELIAEMGRWGMNTTNFIADPNSCQQLYDTLVRNYPCMNGGICTPIGSPTFFIIVMILVMVVVYYFGQYMKERELRK